MVCTASRLKFNSYLTTFMPYDFAGGGTIVVKVTASDGTATVSDKFNLIVKLKHNKGDYHNRYHDVINLDQILKGANYNGSKAFEDGYLKLVQDGTKVFLYFDDTGEAQQIQNRYVSGTNLDNISSKAFGQSGVIGFDYVEQVHPSVNRSMASRC